MLDFRALGWKVKATRCATRWRYRRLVFPGWEFYANAGAEGTLFDLLPNAVVFMDEPTAIEAEQEHWWEKVVQRHEQSLVGKPATPEDIYLPPDEWNALFARLPGGSLEH